MYPDTYTVEAAKREQLRSWIRGLPSPSSPDEVAIRDRIVVRATTLGVFDPAYERDSLVATAMHEAGHAVVTHRFGLPIYTVRIISNEEGVCEHEVGTDEQSAVIAIAGQAAEWFLARKGFRRQGAEDDDDRLAELLGKLPPDMAEKVHDWALTMVAANRQVIRRVAAELLHLRTLTGPQVVAIMEGRF